MSQQAILLKSCFSLLFQHILGTILTFIFKLYSVEWKGFWLSYHGIMIRFLTGVRDASLLQSTEMDSRVHPQPPILLKLRNLLLGVIKLVYEANNSPVSTCTAEVNNQISNSICSHAFMACTGTTLFNLPCKYYLEVVETFPSRGKFHRNPDFTLRTLHSNYAYKLHFKNIRTPVASN